MSDDQRYYFLSALYSGDAPQWVRNPFMTKEQVIRWVKKMDPKQYGSIQIFDEETLKMEFYLKDKNDEIITKQLIDRFVMKICIYYYTKKISQF